MRTLALAMLLSAAPALADEIVIGQSTPLTGANAELGNDIRNGALAYFKKVNDAGGPSQRKIKLVTLDDRNDTKLSKENTIKLVTEQKAVALFGYASSTLSIPAMPTVAEHKVAFFAPFTGADTIRKQNDYVYTIRATYADEIQKIINFWGSQGTTKVTVLHYDDAVGKQNFETVATVLKKFGSEPVSVAIKRNTDITEANVKAVIASDPHVLVVTTLYAPAAQMVQQLRAANRAAMITSLSFAGASALAKALGPDANAVSMAITVPEPRSRSIAAKVLVEGMKRSGKEVTRTSLHRALSALGRYDSGGYVVAFKPNFHHGGTYVGMVQLRPNDELRD